MVDANQDGLADLVILTPYEKAKILLQSAEHEFKELDVTPPGGAAEQPWLNSADVDDDGKPELLFAQRNFLRAAVLQAEGENWGFQVKEQINGMASNSRLTAAAPLRNGTNGAPALLLLDAERKVLTLCERNKSGVWQITRNLTLPVSDFSALQAITLGAKQPNAMALLGDNSVAWKTFGGEVWELSELDGYETPIKDAFLHDVVSGDLNNDKRKDLVFLETSKSYLDIVTFEPPHQLVPANRWQVFEERTFRNRRMDGAEPREALALDVTGDGKNDLLVIVHDRIILYLQE